MAVAAIVITIMIAIMVITGQILDAIDQRPGAATEAIFGAFIYRLVMPTA